jgi:hypothetical protein
MAENPRPGTAAVVGPFDVTDQTITTASSSTGVTGSFTLPSAPTQNGFYDLAVEAAIPDFNNVVVVRAVVGYNRAASNLASTVTLATASTTSATHGTLGLTVSNPNLSGVITFTASWSDGTSQAVTFKVRLTRQLILP